MKNYPTFRIPALALLFAAGCSSPPETERMQSERVDVAQAKEAFVRDYTAAIETRSAASSDHPHYTLADTDFTPLWEEARQSENEHVTCLEVPILAATLCVSSEDGGKNFFPMAQRLLFVQPKGSQDIHSYLITLAFAPEYRQRFGCNDRHFHHVGGGEFFSGLAIYTDLGGRPTSIVRYDCGKRIAGIHYTETLQLTDNKEELLKDIIGNISCYLPESTTRGGGGYDFMELFCMTCLSYECLCTPGCYFCFSYPCICESKRCQLCGLNFCTDCKQYCPQCGKELDHCGCGYNS